MIVPVLQLQTGPDRADIDFLDGVVTVNDGDPSPLSELPRAVLIAALKLPASQVTLARLAQVADDLLGRRHSPRPGRARLFVTQIADALAPLRWLDPDATPLAWTGPSIGGFKYVQQDGRWKVDLLRHRVTYDDDPVSLSPEGAWLLISMLAGLVDVADRRAVLERLRGGRSHLDNLVERVSTSLGPIGLALSVEDDTLVLG